MEKNLEILNGYLNNYSKLPVSDSIKIKERFDLGAIPKNRRVFVPGPQDARPESLDHYRASLTFYGCRNNVSIFLMI